VPVQRCIRHKERNVLDHLPERDRPAVKRRLRAVWKLTDHAAARDRLGISPPSSSARTPAPPHRSGQNGDMCLRWTAAGMLEAERQFRRIIGYKHLAGLAVAVERHITTERAAITIPTTPTPEHAACAV